VALATIKGEKTLSDLAELFDVRSNQITAWKAQLLDGAAGVFGSSALSAEAAPLDLKALHAKVGTSLLFCLYPRNSSRVPHADSGEQPRNTPRIIFARPV